ncbi:MAG: class I SAM-dependent methyltransferase [Elusimicrobia bacterium]|nr:class I SAM-dependent methyltransferase [Elusimicrobiota bacterium]
MPRIKDWTKERFPMIYFQARRVFTACRMIKGCLEQAVETARYEACRRTRAPYFGSLLAASQVGTRAAWLAKCARAELKNFKNHEFRILEIGSWAGSSAVIWARAIKNSAVKGSVLCVDPWEPYINQENIGCSQTPLVMERALQKGQIYELFLHNIRACGMEDIVQHRKGPSDQVLPTLSEQTFHIVYIDGSHFYSQVIKDLENSERLIIEGGILCGDDLDLQRHEIVVAHAQENRERDYIRDLKLDKPFHPGVTLAVAEFFGGEVSCYEGFWAMRKTKFGWQKIYLR